MDGQVPNEVYASAIRFLNRYTSPPSLGAVIVNYPDAQVRMSFNAHTKLGEEDVTTVVGTRGTLRTRGPGLNDQPEWKYALRMVQSMYRLRAVGSRKASKARWVNFSVP